MNMNLRFLFLLLVTVLLSCGKVEKRSNAPVLISLLGKPYFEPRRPQNVQNLLDSNLRVAMDNWKANPTEENYIWYGRRLGYLSRFQEAIDILTEGIAKFPASGQLYRHRGHRFISLRQFDQGIEDLKIASKLVPPFPYEVEPDGVPNSINTPLSSTQFNIYYHLALAYYLKGDFGNAELAYNECLKTCTNDDLLVACVDWMYMTYRRAGKEELARSILSKVNRSMAIVENDSYFKRCQLYQGFLPPDSVLDVNASDADQADLALATQGYGVGNWYLCNGDSAKAKEVFEKTVSGKYFGAFGFIAAEAELARWKK